MYDCISNPNPKFRLDGVRVAPAVQFAISDFGFEMQDSSNFKISGPKLVDSSGMLTPFHDRNGGGSDQENVATQPLSFFASSEPHPKRLVAFASTA
jgi:hypothetical protein